MYLIFNKNGHWETTISERPQSVAEGYFMLEGESLEQTYAYSDGRQIWQTDIAPPSQYHRLEDGQWILPATASVGRCQSGQTAPSQRCGTGIYPQCRRIGQRARF